MVCTNTEKQAEKKEGVSVCACVRFRASKNNVMVRSAHVHVLGEGKEGTKTRGMLLIDDLASMLPVRTLPDAGRTFWDRWALT